VIYKGLSARDIDQMRGIFICHLGGDSWIRTLDDSVIKDDPNHNLLMFDNGVEVACPPPDPPATFYRWQDLRECWDISHPGMPMALSGHIPEANKKRNRSMRTYVRLFKDGDQMSVETNANTEDEFRDAFVAKLAGVIDGGQFNGDMEFQLGYWLKQYAEICCKLRGYKADVVERRVISAGWVEPPASAEVVTGAPAP